MIYQLYLRRRGGVIHRQVFEADGDLIARDVAGAVFHSTDQHWDAYDIWEGSRCVGGTIAEKRDRLAANVEDLAVLVEEAIQTFDKFANDEKLRARISEVRNRRPRLATV